jgi:hypothetical protein
MKILPVGAELFRADGRTDRHVDRHDEANSHFSQFRERAEQHKIYIKTREELAVNVKGWTLEWSEVRHT